MTMDEIKKCFANDWEVGYLLDLDKHENGRGYAIRAVDELKEDVTLEDLDTGDTMRIDYQEVVNPDIGGYEWWTFIREKDAKRFAKPWPFKKWVKYMNAQK
ncbi:hypothetical protein [Limosilactobacillus antri]|uniref:hypothetical protein n=1 Tax=Limosilactobacillus antri TaxID=227943 RepID=UPI001F59A517|nr:hypothetical protein [Limosilactobacillus antri]